MANFGLELVMRAHNVDNVADAFVATVHWCLLDRGLRAVGLGEVFAGGEVLSEVLPAGWNAAGDGNLFAVRYRHSAEKANKFALKAIKDGELYNVALLRLADEKVTTVMVDTKATFASEGVALVDEDGFVAKIFADLVDPLMPADKKAEADAKDNPRPGQSSNPGSHREPAGSHREPAGSHSHDPLRIGGSDLDPLGRLGGGGMVMDPARRGGFRGGPRFDPVRPGFDPGFPRPRRDFGDDFGPPGFNNPFM